MGWQQTTSTTDAAAGVLVTPEEIDVIGSTENRHKNRWKACGENWEIGNQPSHAPIAVEERMNSNENHMRPDIGGNPLCGAMDRACFVEPESGF